MDEFNGTNPSPREIRTMRDHTDGRVQLYDVWEAAAAADAAGGATFRGMGLRDRVGRMLTGPRRIDYVFYRPYLPVLNVRRVDFERLVSRDCARPSDHFPVVADFLL